MTIQPVRLSLDPQDFDRTRPLSMTQIIGKPTWDLIRACHAVAKHRSFYFGHMRVFQRKTEDKILQLASRRNKQ